MADGTGTLGLRPAERAHLSDALDRGRHLVARCASPSCRRTSPCDPGPWLAEGLGGLPLAAFSERLRCVCGARQADLEVRPGPPPSVAHRDLYVFR